MGSQFLFVAQRKSKNRGLQQKAENEALPGIPVRLRKMTPFYAVSYAAQVPRLAILGREARFRQGVAEAMHFYSESQMR